MSAIQTYILYYIVLIIPTIIIFTSNFIKEKKGKIILFLIAIILLTIIGGLRYNTGTDFKSYMNIYMNISQTSSIIDFIKESRLEPGWIIINWLTVYIFNDVQYVFIISTFLICTFGFIAIYKHRNDISTPIAIVIFIATIFFPSFNLIRQYLAISILLLSIKPLINKQRNKFIILVLLAMLFHYMSIVFVFMYWFVNSKREGNQRIKNTFTVMSFIILLYFSPEMISYFTNLQFLEYYNRYELELEFGIGILLIRLPALFIIMINYKKLKENTNLSKLILIYVISLIVLNLGNFADFVGRLGRFYEIVEIFLMGAIIKAQKGKYERFFMTGLIIVYYLFWFTYNFIYKHREGIIPYDSVILSIGIF